MDLFGIDTITNQKLHIKHKFSPFEGWHVQGVPVHTIPRSRSVMIDGEVIDPPMGELVRPI